MKSLFYKVFFWSWLTLILALATATLLTIAFESGPWFKLWRMAIEENIKIAGQGALAEFERGGRTAVVTYFHKIGCKPYIRFFLYNEKGQEITGQRTTQTMDHVAGQSLSQNGFIFKYQIEKFLAARRLTSSSGNPYVIVRQASGGVIAGLFAKEFPSILLKIFLIAVISGILSYFLTRTITKPIFKLQKVVTDFAAGDLTVRAKSLMGNRKDEITQLAGVFDGMADKLEALMNAQQRLLRDISHELRSPLSRLSIALDLIRKDHQISDNKYFNQIEKEAHRLNQLIDQLIRLVRIENQTAEEKFSPVALTKLIRGIVSNAEFEAQKYNCKIKCNLTEGVLVNGDKNLLHSAIENIIRNAIYYTTPGTGIEISLNYQTENNQNNVVISVRDNGPGVPEEHLKDIFRPFFRLDEARDRRSGKAGLGLSIVDHVIRMHKGAAIECSNAPDGGLVVKILLPMDI